MYGGARMNIVSRRPQSYFGISI